MTSVDRVVTDVDWYRRTQHCGRCGQPDGYCLCRDSAPCGCRELHRMGSGLQPDALETFAEAVEMLGQESLFGDDGSA